MCREDVKGWIIRGLRDSVMRALHGRLGDLAGLGFVKVDGQDEIPRDIISTYQEEPFVAYGCCIVSLQLFNEVISGYYKMQ